MWWRFDGGFERMGGGQLAMIGIGKGMELLLFTVTECLG